jgi:hypothetical protein
MRNPRIITATREELDKVAPKPLSQGYLFWGDDKGKFVFDFKTEKIMETNEFGAFILECLTKNDTVDQIVEKACREWDADREHILADIREFIGNLQPAVVENKATRQG